MFFLGKTESKSEYSMRRFFSRGMEYNILTELQAIILR